MRIEVYGTGCPKCRRLEAHTRQALSSLGRAAEVVKVEDVAAIADAGVMRTPALGINGRIVFQGRVPEVAELANILGTALAEAT